MPHWMDKVAVLLTTDTADLRKLALMAGGNPRTFYRGIRLEDLDLAYHGDIGGMEFGETSDADVAHATTVAALGKRDIRAEGLDTSDDTAELSDIIEPSAPSQGNIDDAVSSNAYRVAALEPAIRSKWSPQAVSDLVFETDGAYLDLELNLKNMTDLQVIMVELSGEAKAHSLVADSIKWQELRDAHGADFLRRTIAGAPPEHVVKFDAYDDSRFDLRVSLAGDANAETSKGDFVITVAVAIGWLTPSRCEIAVESYLLTSRGEPFTSDDLSSGRVPAGRLKLV